MARHSARRDAQADKSSRRTFNLDAAQRLSANKRLFGQRDDPAQPGLVRIGGAIDVVSIQGKARLGSQRVARTEAARAARIQETRPDGLAKISVDDDLEAVFTRVASTRDKRVRTCHVRANKGVAAQLRQLSSAQRLKRCLGVGTLYTDQRCRKCAVLEVDGPPALVTDAGEPLEIGHTVRGVEYKQNLVRPDHVGDD